MNYTLLNSLIKSNKDINKIIESVDTIDTGINKKIKKSIKVIDIVQLNKIIKKIDYSKQKMDYNNLKNKFEDTYLNNNCVVYKQNEKNKIDIIMKFDSVPLEEFDKISDKKHDNDTNTIEI
jgi:hypothetical protein